MSCTCVFLLCESVTHTLDLMFPFVISFSLSVKRLYGHTDTSNFPGLASRSSWLLDSICQALALREDGIPFLQRNFTYKAQIDTWGISRRSVKVLSLKKYPKYI